MLAINKVSKITKNLLYEAGNEITQLPAWARFFVEVGAMVAQQEPKTRKIIVIAVPSRAYAAPFTSLGVVLGRSHIAVEEESSEEYFKWLCSLPFGTPVSVKNGTTKSKGSLQGCEFIEKEMITIKTSLRDIHRLPVKECNRITVLNTESIILRNRPFKYKIEEPSDFLKQMLGFNESRSLVQKTRLECVLLGQLNELKAEILKSDFYYASKHQKGGLQEILRVREFQRAEEGYRTQVFSVSNKTLSKKFIKQRPAVTVFDGANSYLRWRDFWKDTNWVVILDRTEAYFNEAVEQANKDYLEWHSENRTNLFLSEVPKGIEAMIYEEVYSEN